MTTPPCNVRRQSFQAEILSCLLMHVPRIKVLKTPVQSTCDASQLFVHLLAPHPSMASVARVEMNELVKVIVQVQYSTKKNSYKTCQDLNFVNM